MSSDIFGGLFGTPARGKKSGSLFAKDDPVILTHDDVRDYNEDNILPQTPETLAKIREWLQPTGYDDDSSEYKKHLSFHLDGTGDWLLSSLRYHTWHDGSDNGLLWIRGIPGSGKSVLAASLIHRLLQEDVPVLYFFFRQTIESNHEPVAALRDWLAQVLKFSPPLQLRMKRILDQNRSLDSVSIDGFWSYLRIALAQLPKAYCVVDALDEMDQTEQTQSFLKTLAELGQSSYSKLKIVMTSRPLAIIEKPLRNAKFVSIRLEEDKVDRDIAVYVQDRLSTSSIPEEYHVVIQRAVPGNANGLFLYAKLAIDSFLRPEASIQQVLKNLPSNLDIMYRDILQEHATRSGMSQDIQILVMQWVTHAGRPLRLLEIAEIINTTQGSKTSLNLKDTKELVRAACGPLLEILPNETICVVHHSLTEFLTGSTTDPKTRNFPILEYGATHNLLAAQCLSYLLSRCLDEVQLQPRKLSFRPAHECPAVVNHDKRWLAAPFLKYAALNWHHHVRKAESAGFDQTAIRRLLNRLLDGENLLKWGALARVWRNYVDATPLLTAIDLGLVDFTRILLERPEEINDIDDAKTHSWALPRAARLGHHRIVDLLLEYGKDVNAFDSEGYTALHHASRHNYLTIVIRLLHAEADPFVRDIAHTKVSDRSFGPFEQKGSLAFDFACMSGHDDVAIALASYFDTSSKATYAFQRAVQSKLFVVADKILKSSLVDINATMTGWFVGTLLHNACEKRDLESIKWLLAAGADPNVLRSTPGSEARPSDVGESALHALTLRREYGIYADPGPKVTAACFDALLRAGANVDQTNPDLETPLHFARDASTVGVLLEAGANPNAATRHGETLLHLSNDRDTIRMLLEDAKADTTLKTYAGYTPLLLSLRDGELDKAIQLVDFGVDVLDINEEGDGIFHYLVGIKADTGKIVGLIERLIASGADINTRNKKGETALHYLGCNSNPFGGRGFSLNRDELDELLLAALLRAGARIDMRDNEGQTPLYSMVTRMGFSRVQGCRDTCEKMIYAGAVLDTTNAEGKTLLQGYLSHGGFDIECFRYLIEKGISPHQADHDGNTLWHIILPRHCQSQNQNGNTFIIIFEEILSLGVSLDQPNHAGWTPLHVASSWVPESFKKAAFNTMQTSSVERATTFERVLELQNDVNFSDQHGVTALHLASTFSQYHTMRLLQAGADLWKTTNDGLTALHLAILNRKTNIAGMLIDALDSVCLSLMVNMQDIRGRTPLYYACASGTIETVKLLLEAGAEIETAAFEGSAWDGCAHIEVAPPRGPSSTIGSMNKFDKPDHGYVTVFEQQLSQPYSYSQSSSEYLFEILELLIHTAGCKAETIDKAITVAAHIKKEFTVECLLHARKSLQFQQNFVSEEAETAAFVARVVQLCDGASPERPRIYGRFPNPSDVHSHKLWDLRFPELAAQERKNIKCLELSNDKRTILHDIVSRGDASKLADLLTPEIISKLEDPEWCLEHEKGSGYMIQPLLITACSREQPNMDVLRVLVESIGVNLDSLSRSKSGWDLVSQSALHILVRGDFWWQVGQALPYFIKKGANMEIRDGEGRTPLNYALRHAGTIIFQRKAVETLIELGADVNSVDDRGKSCLARARVDTGLTKLLLDHGAIVTYPALIAAIDDRDADGLELLLSTGADVNERETKDQSKPKTEHAMWMQSVFSTPSWKPNPFQVGRRSRRHGLPPYAMHLLHHAAWKRCSSNLDAEGISAYDRIARILIHHGADFCTQYEGTTVSHAILSLGCFSWVSHELPLEHVDIRDDSGETLLLSACHWDDPITGQFTDYITEDIAELSPVQLLVRKGADIRARDNKGCNVLHKLLPAEGKTLEAVRYFVSQAPEIVNQVSEEGIAPLHLATSLSEVRLLLDAGAHPSIRDDRGQTALYLAVSRLKENTDVIDALFDAGSNPHSSAKDGNTPFHLLLGGVFDVSEDGVVIGPRRQLLDRLLALGVDINLPNSLGETPVFSFFRSGHIDRCSSWAKTQEAKTNVGNHLVSQTGPSLFSPQPVLESKPGLFGNPVGRKENFEALENPVFDLLEKMGVDFGVVNHAKETLLHIVAAERNKSHIQERRFQYLMGKGLYISAEDNQQRTPLDVAAALGNRHITNLFEAKHGGLRDDGAEDSSCPQPSPTGPFQLFR
ncbi:Ankyrin-2 [Colletotrichum fructicola]|nr:Ankyrin-2 [Colletotrichum fructicola]